MREVETGSWARKTLFFGAGLFFNSPNLRYNNLDFIIFSGDIKACVEEVAARPFHQCRFDKSLRPKAFCEPNSRASIRGDFVSMGKPGLLRLAVSWRDLYSKKSSRGLRPPETRLRSIGPSSCNDLFPALRRSSARGAARRSE